MSNRTWHAWRLTVGALLLLALFFLCPPVASAGLEPEGVLLPDRTAVGPINIPDRGDSSPWTTVGTPTLALSAGPAPAAEVTPYQVDPLRNGSFESGTFMYWNTSGSPSVLSTGGYDGWHSALLGGRNNANDRVSQVFQCPFSTGRVLIGFALLIQTDEVESTPRDCFAVGFDNYKADFHKRTCNNWDRPGAWEICIWLPPGESQCSRGATREVSFSATTDNSYPTWFLLDYAWIWLSCLPDPYEPNNTFATAATGSNIYDLVLCPEGDEDWFRFEATAGQLIYLRLGIKEAGQATVCLVSPSGQEVGCDWDVYPNTATLARTATESGSWRARVHDPGYQTGGSLLQLGIEIMAEATPTASPTLPGAAATPTRTPTRTRTRTPWPTLPGGVRRLHLPVLARDHWTPRPQDCTELLTNGGFESGGLGGWSQWGDLAAGAGRLSANGAQLGGRNNAEGELWQWVYIPAGAKPATWEFWWKAEATSPQPDDRLHVYVESQQVNTELVLLRAEAPLHEWRHVSLDLSPWAGRWAMVAFFVGTDGSVPTTFRVDDVSVKACLRP